MILSFRNLHVDTTIAAFPSELQRLVMVLDFTAYPFNGSAISLNGTNTKIQLVVDLRFFFVSPFIVGVSCDL